MERKKCIKYIIVIWFSFAGFWVLEAQQSPKERVYQAYIADQMDDWDRVILEMSKRKSALSDQELGELINYYYGYTGWLIEKGPKKKANTYIEEADKIIDELIAKYPEASDWYAYKGAFYGYKIGLSPVRAPFLGGQSMSNIDRAIETGPERPQGWVERGNALFYMPKAFGGSKTEALEAYKKAIRFMEKNPETLHHNWTYLNVLLILGQSYEKTGDFEMAKATYEKLLRIEPNFTYLRDELYPAFMRTYREQR